MRTGERHSTTAPIRPADRGEDERRAQADDLGQHAGGDRRRELRAVAEEEERRRDPAELAIGDDRLANGRVGDVEYRRSAVADELLHRRRQASATSGRRRGRERDERIADRQDHHRRDRDRADAPAADRAVGDDRADERSDAAGGRDQADRRGSERQVVDREEDPGRPEHAPQDVVEHLREGEGAQDRVLEHDPDAHRDLGPHRFPGRRPVAVAVRASGSRAAALPTRRT